METKVNHTVLEKVLKAQGNMGTTQVSIQGWKDQEKGVCTYNGTSLSLKTKGNPTIWDKMDGPWGITLSEISQKTNTAASH